MHPLQNSSWSTVQYTQSFPLLFVVENGLYPFTPLPHPSPRFSFDPFVTSNGVLGGLVAITASSPMVRTEGSFVIGLVSGLLVFYGSRMLLSFKVRDFELKNHPLPSALVRGTPSPPHSPAFASLPPPSISMKPFFFNVGFAFRRVRTVLPLRICSLVVSIIRAVL